ncbi:SusE domain-containing protein [Chryseobacterium sp.]|uniref:SusE domain-containing protein n=1 Tax=Chryseobacterium sp. TaxID=1871047 RepID=UPI0028A1FC35|nr:SusE domain-containing protein [Chryseobacterium sp.]
MKKIFKLLSLAIFTAVAISCEKDEDIASLGEGTTPVLSSDKSSVVLMGDKPDANALTFNWVNSDFGVNVQVANQLEIDKKGNNFVAPKTVDLGNGLKTQSITVNELNNIILSLGVSSVVETEIQVRLKSTVANKMYYSNILDLKVTPFINGPVYTFTDLYLIGDATAGAWDNNAGNTKIYPLLKSTTSNQYSYTGYFAAGGFKMIKTPGSWDTQYGLGASAGVLSMSGGSGDIKILTAGYYKLTVNTAALTYTLAPISVSPATYTSISLIGSSVGGWSTDLDLEKSTFDPHVWTKRNVMLSSGEFKIRANHEWTSSWGVAQEFFGTATTSGGNIPLATTFTYNIFFNDATGDYSIIPVN